MLHLEVILFGLLALAISSTDSGYIPPGPRYTCPTEHDKQLLLHPCVCEAGSDQGIFVSCRQAGLAVLSVGLGNVATLNVPIERLVIRECHIDNLFGPLLYRVKVRVLRIEDTPIRTIDQYTFMGINTTLQELHIINTRLDRFPKEAFRILGNLTLLNLDNHNISSLDKDSFAMSLASGRIEKLHVTNGKLTELPVEPFQALRKLKTLDLHSNMIKTLKRSQFKGLRDVELLDLSHNSLTKLDGSHLGDLTKLGWCNVSHNSIGDIPRGMFARNTVLKVLHLNSNKIKKLDTNSFRGMRFLRRLYLQDNQITDVGRGTFGGITRIGTIDLARNRIKKIDFQMFYQLNYVEIIDVSENQVTEIQKLSFKDLYLTHINMSHNQISKIEDGAFENCANMTVLDLSFNNLTEIPRNAFDVNTFPSEFQLSYNGFTELNQIPVHNMTGLRVLNVSHNQIHTIPMKTFPKLYELNTVDISHNKLQQIASAVFQSLFSLRFIYMSHNELEQIKPPTFGTLPTLLELDLSHNKLRDIARGSLAKLASCRLLDVSHNQLQSIFQLPISLGELNFAYNNLSEIKDRTWPSMNALLRLNLAHNQLEDRLGPETFRGLLTLQKLDLTANGVTKPPWEALSSLSSLQYLHLQHNNITTLTKAAFGRLPIVFELDMSYNQISNISERAFEGLLQLLTLSLRGNQIKHIPNGAFKGLVSMRELDLSRNKLVRLDNKTNGLLDDCLSLDMVNLSSNDISFITRKMFPSSPWIPYRLRTIDLSHNVMPVVTFDLTYGTKTVYSLNLSHNIINDIRKDVLSNLTSLRLLDLSHNQLQDMSSQAADTIFRLPTNITDFILSYNDMAVLPMKQIVQAKKLQRLDVSHNHLQQFDPVLVQRIRADGLQVHFQDNHLTCDCKLRPLKHYLNHLPKSVLDLEARYTNLSCYEPYGLRGETVLDVDEDRLVCPPGVGDAEGATETNNNNFDFVSEPDLTFRDVQFAQTSIFVEWYVLSSEDVADFHVFIRDSKNNIYFTNVLSYVKRSYIIEITENEDLEKAIQQNIDLELCVLPRSSDGVTRKWFEDQCRPLPKNFEMLKTNLELGRKLSSDVRVQKVRTLSSATSSSTLHLVSDSVLITLIIFLGVCVPYVSVVL